MGRKAKEGIRFNANLAPEVNDDLEWFVEMTNFNKTTVVENALTYYVESFRKSGKIPICPKKTKKRTEETI